jgi:DNA repair protein RadC
MSIQQIKSKHKKRVNIISLKVVKESSVLYEGRKISSPSDVIKLIKPFFDCLDREKFLVIYLNTKNEPNAIHTVSIGSLNSSIVHPREVYKGAIMTNAAAVIFAHNHPSGNPSPSKNDKEITNRLIEAGEILGIKILDHIIIGGQENYYSFKEHNII